MPAALADGVTTTKGVWLIRTGDGLGLFLHPGSAVRIAFSGPDIQLQFIGTRTSGWVRVTEGRIHRDVNLRSARSRRWLISLRTKTDGPHVLRIVDLASAAGHHHAGTAILSRLHVYTARTAQRSARAI